MNVFLNHGNPYTCGDPHDKDKTIYKNSHSNENPYTWKYWDRAPGYQSSLYVLFFKCLSLLCLTNAASTDCFQESYRYCHMDEHCRKCCIAPGITYSCMNTEWKTMMSIHQTVILEVSEWVVKFDGLSEWV